MSEKERFVVGSNEIGEIIITDVETGKVYECIDFEFAEFEKELLDNGK